MPTDSQRRARKRYRAKGKRLTIEFFASELKMINWLERQEAKATYIKDLIRADMQLRGDSEDESIE